MGDALKEVAVAWSPISCRCWRAHIECLIYIFVDQNSDLFVLRANAPIYHIGHPNVRMYLTRRHGRGVSGWQSMAGSPSRKRSLHPGAQTRLSTITHIALLGGFDFRSIAKKYVFE